MEIHLIVDLKGLSSCYLAPLHTTVQRNLMSHILIKLCSVLVLYVSF